MSNTVIKVQQLSKAYQLGEFSTGTLSRDVERWWALMRGKSDPYLKLGEVNDREVSGSSDVVWSLRDIDLEIEQGDAVGLIGRNGAGKSTLLKILSRVTTPTTGSVKLKGRIASLLEVGTGFHPDLTGRENIFLNGAILGMRKKEIVRRFDEIVNFAGVERYVDTPVKRYSSGMYVRLAFAVAAHLESEILIVDEVLAVGDADFQKKCLGKMSDVSKGEGRTVLFVSHNMAAISSLCQKSALLKHGTLQSYGNTRDILNTYLAAEQSGAGVIYHEDIVATGAFLKARYHSIKMFSELNGAGVDFAIDEAIHVEVEYEVLVENSLISTSVHIMDYMENTVLATFNAPSASLARDEFYGKPLKRGRYAAQCTIPAFFLNDQQYAISAFLVADDGSNEMLAARKVLSFTVTDTGAMRQEYTGEWIGVVRPKLHWQTRQLS